MNIKEYLDLAEMITITRASKDQVIFKGKGFVFGAVIASDGVGEADADLYDGTDASGTKKYDLYTVDEALTQLKWNPPACFVKGCFVDIGTNCESVTVRYLQR